MLLLTEINSEFTVPKNNLKPWQPGISGNPKGRPKGSRNIKKVIQDMLNDPKVYDRLPRGTPRNAETPLEAILYALMVKAARGDIRAIDVLLKYSVDKDTTDDRTGFFAQNELRIVVMDTTGAFKPETIPDIDETTGMLVGYEPQFEEATKQAR